VTSVRPTPPRMVPAASVVDHGGAATLRPVRSVWREPAPGPRRTVSRVAMATDLALVAATGTLGVSVLPWFGTAHPLDAVVVVVALTALLGTSLALGRCWAPAVVATGGVEYGRVVQAGTGALLVLALTEVALRDYRLQPITLVVLPLAVVAVLAGRGIGRVVRHRRRRRGIGLVSVLAVGSAASVADLVHRTRRAPEHGWTVVAACTPAGRGECAGVPVIGDLDDVAERAGRVGVEVVAVGAAPGWTGRRLQQLAWALEGTDLDLVVDDRGPVFFRQQRVGRDGTTFAMVPPAPARAARHDRALAGLRTLRPLVGGDRAPRPALRRELVARSGPAHPRPHRRRRRHRPRRVLTHPLPARRTP
jgi:hypothetical protein